MWNFPQILPAQKKYDLLDFVHQDENNNVSIKFGPSLVYNQDLEEEFRTPKCIFRNPEASRSFTSPFTQQSSKKPVIKLQRSASSSSFNSKPSIFLNTMGFGKAKDFRELESIIQ